MSASEWMRRRVGNTVRIVDRTRRGDASDYTEQLKDSATIVAGRGDASSFTAYTGGVAYSAGTAANPVVPIQGTLTILQYDQDQGFSVMWDRITFVRDIALPNYSYSCEITSIPAGVPDVGIGWVVSSVPFRTNLTAVTIGNLVTSISNGAFAFCEALTSIVIPNSVTSIGNSAFEECDSLTSIVIPNSVTSIGNSAFYYCDSLISVTLGNSVVSIGDSAFEECELLTSIVIPNSVTSIGNSAFYYCDSLISVTLGNLVTSIDDYAFESTALTSIVIPNSVTSIGTSAFRYCDNLESITLGNSVTSIGANAFEYADFTSIAIPSSVTSIGTDAFVNSSLTTVTIADGQLGKPSPATDVDFFGRTVQTLLP